MTISTNYGRVARFCVGISVLAIPFTVFGQSFVQVPGQKEFTGEVIVRPKQLDALRKAGYSTTNAHMIKTRAANRMAGTIMLEYVAKTDEYIVRVPVGTDENTYARQLMQTGDYQYVEPNWMCYPTATPNDPKYAQQWHHPKIQANLAWDILIGSPSVTLAIVDTGIDIDHPDLVANRVPGYNSADRVAEVNGGQVDDVNGHGTHCSGDAAAIGNNAIGVTGVGWNFKIMGIRATNAGGGAFMADLLDGARWAADNGAKVVSVSFTGVDGAAIQTTGAYVKSKNALMCWAAGNDNRNLSGFSHPDVIVVGASDPNDAKAGFSAYGKGVHVFAPGVNIMSTTMGGGYGNSSGTSMATPVTNGALGMIWAADPTRTAQEVQDILENNCDNIGPSTTFGKGRINVFKAVLAAVPKIEKEFAPTTYNTFEGTWIDGGLTELTTPSDTNIYHTQSVVVDRLGHSTTTEFSFQLADPLSNIAKLNIKYQTEVDPDYYVTGMVFLYNFSTGKYEKIHEYPIPVDGAAPFTKSYTKSFGKYISGSGEVRVRYRALIPNSRGRVPQRFNLLTDYIAVTYQAKS